MSGIVKTYLEELRQVLPYVPPIPVRALRSLHRARDYEGMLRLIKKAMNVEVRLVVGWVNSGGPEEMKNAPAWVRMPVEMPFYGTKAFRESSITMYFRKSFLEQCTYDQVAITIAHELSHVVLDSIKHPLRSREMAVDLTAMLLGFRRLYASGCYKEERFKNRVACQKLGYLSIQEVQFANRTLAQTHWRSKIENMSPRLNALTAHDKIPFAAALFIVVGVAALLGTKEFYRTWQLHQTLLEKQAEMQTNLPMRLNDNMTWVGVRAGLTTLTYIVNVTTRNIDPLALEAAAREILCASSDAKHKISEGASYNYEYRDRSSATIAQFEIASCP
jgi:hypothetical protein